MPNLEITKAANRLKEALKEKFEPAADTRIAARVGTGLVSIHGQFAPGNIEADAEAVVNVGRPSAAQYAAANGSTVVIGGGSGGGSSTTIAGGVSASDVDAKIATAIANHANVDWMVGHHTGTATANVNKFYYSWDWGVRGGAGIDESANIETMLDQVGATGGGTCIVTAVYPETYIYINKVINLAWSNTHLVFRSPIVRGGLAGIRIMGELGQYVVPGKAAAKLASNATAGALTMTLSNTTGGTTPPMVDTDFAVGNKIVIRGRNTVTGKAEQKELNIITAINTSTHVLTLKYELDYTYQPTYTTGSTPLTTSDWPADATTGTTIYKLKFNAFTTNIGRGVVSAVLTANDYFAVGDTVMVSGDETEWDMNNAAVKATGTPPANRYANPCNMEFVKIIAISGTTVYFDRALLRDYTTAMNGGITLIEPVVNSSISGVDITWNAEDASTSYTTLQMTYAESCQIYNCRINGFNLAITNSVTGLPGSGRVGQAIRMSYALNCAVHDVWIEGCGLSGSGQGYGITWYYCTLCYAWDCIVIGCRHNYLFQCATMGRLWDSESRRHHISGVDFHGVRDESCDVDNVIATQADDITSDSSNASCFRVGNTSHCNGSFKITFTSCKAIAANGASDMAYDVIAASTGIKFINCIAYRCGIGFKLTANATQVGVVAIQTVTDVMLDGCQFIECQDRPWRIVAATVTSAGTVKLDGLSISNFWDIGNNRHLELTGVSGGTNTIQNVRVRNYHVVASVVTSGRYGLLATDMANLTVYKGEFGGCNRGISLTNTTGVVELISNVLTNTTEATPFTDGGGNSTVFHEYNSGYDTVGTGGTGFITDLVVTNVQPRVVWIESDAAANNKQWDVFVNNGILHFRLVNDAASAATDFMSVGTRSANVANELALTATSINLAGNVGIGLTNVSVALAVLGNIKAHQSSNSRYYTTMLATGGLGNIIAFDSTGAAYIPLYIDGSDIHLRTGALAHSIDIDSSGNLALGGASNLATLTVGRGTASGGAAQFKGTNADSHFNYSTTEDTYIRAGKTGAVVYINDSHNGPVSVGAGGGLTTIGADEKVIGNLYSGVTVPSGKLHIANSGRGVLYINQDTIGTSAVDLSQSAVVLDSMAIFGMAKHSVSGSRINYSGEICTVSGSVSKTLGSDTIRINVTAGGKITAIVTAGVGNFTVSLMVIYL